MDPSKLANLFADQRLMQRVLEAIINIENALTSINDKFLLFGDKSKIAFDNMTDRVSALGEGVEDAGDKFSELGRQAKETLEGVRDHFDGATGSMRAFREESENSMTSMQKLGQWGKGMGMQGLRAGGAVIEGFGVGAQGYSAGSNQTVGGISSFLKNLPVANPYVQAGGQIAGTVLDVAEHRGEYNAYGAKVARGFGGTQALTERDVDDDGHYVGEMAKAYKRAAIASPEDLAAQFSAFSTMGRSIHETITNIDKDFDLGFKQSKIFGKSLVDAALQTDKAFGLTNGATAKLAAEMQSNTNTSIEESVALMNKLGVAAQMTGVNMQDIIPAIEQSTSAMRMQNSDASDLAATYTNLIEVYKDQMPGLSAKRMAGLAGGALGEMTGGGGGAQGSLDGATMKQIATRLLGDNAKGMSTQALMNAMAYGFTDVDKSKFQKGVTSEDFLRIKTAEQWKYMKQNLGGDVESEKLFYRTQLNSPQLARTLAMADQSVGGVEGLFARGKFDSSILSARDKNAAAANTSSLETPVLDRLLLKPTEWMKNFGSADLPNLTERVKGTTQAFEALQTRLNRTLVKGEAGQSSDTALERLVGGYNGGSRGSGGSTTSETRTLPISPSHDVEVEIKLKSRLGGAGRPLPAGGYADTRDLESRRNFE